MNRTSARKIIRNFGFLTTGTTLGFGCTFFLFVVVSRIFGQEGIGQYSFAMALTSYLAAFAAFGLNSYTIKEISRHTGTAVDYCGGIFMLRFILSGAALMVLLSILVCLPFSPEAKLIIALIGAYQVIYTLVDGFMAILVAHEDMHLCSVLEFSLRAVSVLVAVGVVMAGGSLVITLATLPAVTCGQLALVYGIVTRKYGPPKLVASWSALAPTLYEAIPYALSSFLFRLSGRVEVLLLGFLFGAASAGVYNVAYRMVFFLMILSSWAGIALFPLASRLYMNSRDEFEALYHQALNLSILIGLPAAAGVSLIAPNLIGLIFGETFAESSSVLRLLAGLLFLELLKTILATFLISCDRQVDMTRSQWMAAGANVVVNIILISLFGIKGAAVATLMSETFLIILFMVRLRMVLGWPRVGSRLAISGVATASFCLPFTFFPSLSPGVVIPPSILIYSGILVLFKEIRRNEVRTLVSLLKEDSGELASKGLEVFSEES